MSLLAELKRRNVIRMAGLYLVGAWLIVQIAETLLPIFHTPDWVLQALVVLLAIGFIPALVFSWIFELTPDGIKRESEVDHTQRSVDHTARKLDVAVIVLLLGIGGMMAWNSQRVATTVAAGNETGTSSAVGNSAEPITDKSIAVLPFADFSPGGDQGWFADGLTEEILNSLTRTPDLLVSARTSSFRYKGSNLAIPQIAAELGVAHVLEGSVRSSSTRIRVTAQLIRAVDGFHLWSQSYDRDVADMITIQEDLARQIATAMQTSMDPAALARMAEVGTHSVEAYQAYLRGLSTSYGFGRDGALQAHVLFEQARQLDPEFAAAHAQAARFWLEQLDPTSTVSGTSDLSPAEMEQQFNERIDLAIRNVSSDTDRLGFQAIKATRELRMRDALALYEKVLAQRPGDLDALSAKFDFAARLSDQDLLQRTLDEVWTQAQTRMEIAYMHVNYSHRTRDKHKAADEALILLQRWQDQPDILYQVHRALLWDGRVEEAAKVLSRWQALGGEAGIWSSIPAARQACADGRRAEVEQSLAQMSAAELSQRWHLQQLFGDTRAAAATLQPLEDAGNPFALAGFLSYAFFDATEFPSMKAFLEREQVQRPPPIAIPFACPPAKSAP